MFKPSRLFALGSLVALLGCRGDNVSAGSSSTVESSTDTSGDGDPGDGDPGDGDPGDGDPGDGDGDPGDGDGEQTFDLGTVPDTGNMMQDPICKVVDDMEAVGPCQDSAPPDAFEPEVQWSFMGVGNETQSMTTPLVANLTDDNNDGEIDLCDVPEVIVALFSEFGVYDGHLYALDGLTGAVQWQSSVLVDTIVTPAIGDIDDDGLPEIVASTPTEHLVAFEHDGTLAWQSDVTWDTTAGSFALADLDNDGTPEIIAGNRTHHVDGTVETTLAANNLFISATTAHDLDDDGDLELVIGNSAWHHDGTLMWETNLGEGFPQVADLDDDGLPEVLLTNLWGISVIEHDGTIKYQDQRPTGDPPSSTTWRRPATIHDFDGDGAAEFALASRLHYAVYDGDASILWQAEVADVTGIAAGTAFDFDGNSVAEAMYADETEMYVFDGMGGVLLQVPRSSATLVEYPVVADVDNDGSAEIIVVSNTGGHDQSAPAVQVVRDVGDRWIQARRIWNQHTYHVTNVREDGTIPQFEQPHWERLNTFRTNAQIEEAGICQPQG